MMNEQEPAYRSLGEERVKVIATAAEEAWGAMVARYEGETIEAFPVMHPLEGDRDAVDGAVVRLHDLGPSDWISEAGRRFLVAGNKLRGFYFIDGKSPGMKQVMAAMGRYRKVVGAELEETYAVIGRIRATPTMRIVAGEVEIGFPVEVLGVTAGGAMFVEPTADGDAPFAGEESLAPLGDVEVPDDSPPERVLQAAMTAIQLDDKEAWSKLYAPWRLRRDRRGGVMFSPYYHESPSEDWERARAIVFGPVYEISVRRVGDVRTVMEAGEFPGAPHIEEVGVEVEHIGRSADGPVPVIDDGVNRVWTLQRADGGPWRIATRRAI